MSVKAFVEITSGIIRSGPDCQKYGDPYEFAVAFSSTDGKTAVIKGLTSEGKFSLAHYRAGIEALKGLGLEADWERIDALHT